MVSCLLCGKCECTWCVSRQERVHILGSLAHDTQSENYIPEAQGPSGKVDPQSFEQTLIALAYDLLARQPSRL